MSVRIEALEARWLLSGVWRTVYDYHWTPAQNSSDPRLVQFNGITADRSGRVYLTGSQQVQDPLLFKFDGQSWLQLHPPVDTSVHQTEYRSPVIGPDGNCYACLNNYRAGPVFGGEIVRDSSNNTVTPVLTGVGTMTGIAFDSSGDLYAVGKSTKNDWAVYKGVPTADGTTGSPTYTFTQVDEFYLAYEQSSTADGITIIPSGPNQGIYVVGESDNGPGNPQTFVRQSTDGGNTWWTVFNGQGASKIISDAQGTLYTAGNIYLPSGGATSYEQIVRKSTDGGTTWSVALDLKAEAEYLLNLGADSAGNLYTVSHYQENYGASVVRSNAGGSWAVIDRFIYAPGWDTVETAIAANPAGGILVSGYAFSDFTQPFHSFVRSYAERPNFRPARFRPPPRVAPVSARDTLRPTSESISQEWTGTSIDSTLLKGADPLLRLLK